MTSSVRSLACGSSAFLLQCPFQTSLSSPSLHTQSVWGRWRLRRRVDVGFVEFSTRRAARFGGPAAKRRILGWQSIEFSL